MFRSILFGNRKTEYKLSLINNNNLVAIHMRIEVSSRLLKEFIASCFFVTKITSNTHDKGLRTETIQVE